MTIGELLRTIEIEDYSTGAVYPNRSKQTDTYMLNIVLDGHGNLLDAEVKRVFVQRGYIVINADGIKGEGA